jgi:hypothetical protein
MNLFSKITTIMLIVIIIVSVVSSVNLIHAEPFFSSDFESGDLSQWTGTRNGGGAAVPTVQQITFYQGDYALKATAPSMSNSYSVAYKDLL